MISNPINSLLLLVGVKNQSSIYQELALKTATSIGAERDMLVRRNVPLSV